MSPEQKAVQEQVQRCIDQLMEHCDSVRIFVTMRDPVKEESHSYTRGGGNGYAQIGLVKEWVIDQDQITRNNAGGRKEEE